MFQSGLRRMTSSHNETDRNGSGLIQLSPCWLSFPSFTNILGELSHLRGAVKYHTVLILNICREHTDRYLLLLLHGARSRAQLPSVTWDMKPWGRRRGRGLRGRVERREKGAQKGRELDREKNVEPFN